MDISGTVCHLSLTSGLFRLALMDLVQVWTGEVCKLKLTCDESTVDFALFHLPDHQQMEAQVSYLLCWGEMESYVIKGVDTQAIMSKFLNLFAIFSTSHVRWNILNCATT